MTEGYYDPVEVDAREVHYEEKVKWLQAELEKWKISGQKLSDAYLRLRAMIPGAFDTPFAPTPEQVWRTTEDALSKLVGKP